MSTPDKNRQRHNALTRREFFTWPLAHLGRGLASPAEDGAVPGRIPLSALREIPEAVLMQMTPVLREGWTAHIMGTSITFRSDQGQEGVVPLELEGCAATRLFDGTRTLAQVASVIEGQFGMTPSRGVSIVREAFLTLAEREVYHPDGPLDPFPDPPKTQKQNA
jgi:hypothetical protein